MFVLGLGLLLFGLCVGGLTGLSNTPGISGVLLPALFTFAGVLLSFVGFRKRLKAAKGSAGHDAPTEATLNPKALGGGLGAFSAGVILGVLLGGWVRITSPRWFPLPQVPGKADPHDPRPQPAAQNLGPQAITASTCREISERVRQDFYVGGEGCSAAQKDLTAVSEQCGKPMTTGSP